MEETIYNIGLEMDMRFLKTATYNDKKYRYRSFNDNMYNLTDAKVRFYQKIIRLENYNMISNVSEFGEYWYSSSIKQSRTQIIIYNSNLTSMVDSEGVPMEIIHTMNEDYVMMQNRSEIECGIMNKTKMNTTSYEYYKTMFLVPSSTQVQIIWGPRLVDIYTASDISKKNISYILGLDAFNDDFVMFVIYGESLHQYLIVNDYTEQTIDEDNVILPKHVNCSNTTVNWISDFQQIFSIDSVFYNYL